MHWLPAPGTMVAVSIVVAVWPAADTTGGEEEGAAAVFSSFVS